LCEAGRERQDQGPREGWRGGLSQQAWVAYGSGGACGVGQNLSIRLPHVSNGRNTAKWIWRGVAGCWPTSRSLWWKGISLRVADDPLHGPDKRHGVREDLGGTLAVSVTGTLRDRCFLCKKTPHHPQVAVVSLRYSHGATSRGFASREGSLLEGVLLAQSGYCRFQCLRGAAGDHSVVLFPMPLST